MEIKNYLPLLRILSELDSESLNIILPHLESNVREAIYTCVFKVIYHSKGRLNQDLRQQLNEVLRDKKDELDILARKDGDKLKKRRMLYALGHELRVILNAAIPLMIVSLANSNLKK